MWFNFYCVCLSKQKNENMEVILLIIGIVAMVALAKSIKELDRKEDEFTNTFEE